MQQEVAMVDLKIEFFQLSFFKILRDEYGFRSAYYNGKKNFLKKERNSLIKVPYFDVKDKGLEHLIKNFFNYKLGENVELEDLENAFYKLKPLNNQQYAHQILSEHFNLSQLELNNLALKS